MLDGKVKKKKRHKNQEHLGSPIAIRKAAEAQTDFKQAFLYTGKKYRNINVQQPE